MATVLVTGGSGMIGTALSKALVNKGHDVIILTRHP
ncbi:MAG TPA: NAD-dependent epimerase/dehydratase family protein, partial [Flavisolibacter sp.]|nr:NAD-dependent epimerase/dehydratase family protein [Flavisolibacter sp.]